MESRALYYTHHPTRQAKGSGRLGRTGYLDVWFFWAWLCRSWLRMCYTITSIGGWTSPHIFEPVNFFSNFQFRSSTSSIIFKNFNFQFRTIFFAKTLSSHTSLLSSMTVVRRTTRNGQPGSLVRVAPRAGYERFAPDKYKRHSKPRPRNY